MKNFTLIILFNLITLSQLVAQNFEWANHLAATGNTGQVHTVVDKNGNTYATGSFAGSYTIQDVTINSITTLNDFWVAKFNKNGSLIWLQQAGGEGADVANAITLDAAGNVLICGAITANPIFAGTSLEFTNFYDAFVAKLTKTGTLTWVKTFGGADFDEFADITTDKNGNVFVVGSEQSDSVNFAGEQFIIEPGNISFVVNKYAADGTELWMQHNTSSGGANGLQIASDKKGNIYAFGAFLGDAIINGQNFSSPQACILIKFTNNGLPIWENVMNIIGGTTSCDLVTDLSGNAYLGVTKIGGEMAIQEFVFDTFNSEGYGILAKFNKSNGDVIWAESYNGENVSSIYDICINSANELLVAGAYYNALIYKELFVENGFDDEESYILKVDLSGNPISLFDFNNPESGDYITAINTDQFNTIYYAGNFSGIIEFDDNTFGALGVEDNFMAKLTPVPFKGSNNNTAQLTDNINVFPNPAQNAISVRFISEFEGAAAYSINSVVGQVLITNTINVTEGENSILVNIENLPSGIYILKIEQCIIQFTKM